MNISSLLSALPMIKIWYFKLTPYTYIIDITTLYMTTVSLNQENNNTHNLGVTEQAVSNLIDLS